jgi:ribosomal protein L11
MAKPITAMVKLQVVAGQATPAPPVGTARSMGLDVVD